MPQSKPQFEIPAKGARSFLRDSPHAQSSTAQVVLIHSALHANRAAVRRSLFGFLTFLKARRFRERFPL